MPSKILLLFKIQTNPLLGFDLNTEVASINDVLPWTNLELQCADCLENPAQLRA